MTRTMPIIFGCILFFATTVFSQNVNSPEQGFLYKQDVWVTNSLLVEGFNPNEFLNKYIVTPMLDGIRMGKIKGTIIYRSQWMKDREYIIDSTNLNSFLLQVDTIYIENPDPPYDMIMQVSKIKIDEKFIGINLLQSVLTKNTKVRLNVSTINLVAELNDYLINIFSFKNIGLPFEFPDHKIKVITEATVKTNKISDEKWFDNNMEASTREAWIGKNLKDVENGELVIYSDKECINKLDKIKAQAAALSTDTMYIENPDPPYELGMRIVSEYIRWPEITNVLFNEEWTVENGVLKRNILSYAFCRWNPKKNEAGPPLFWVKNE